MISYEQGQRILALRETVVAHFDANDWDEVGLLTGFSDPIHNHPRLLRSLSFGDEDYAGCALAMIRNIAEHDDKAFRLLSGTRTPSTLVKRTMYRPSRPSGRSHSHRASFKSRSLRPSNGIWLH
jgi:hypothetical protein